jgi:hypothetical protein
LEEHGLGGGVKNKVVKGILGAKRDKMARGWRILHNEQLHILYSSPSTYNQNEVKEDELGRACSKKGYTRNAYKIFVETPEEKITLRMPRRR